MHASLKVLTILGSPQDKRSNTRALVEDFLEEASAEGLTVEHRVISLARKKVRPCVGCWTCTREKPCPLSRQDDLAEIKAAMLDCDMLILASPVYENNVTAQMKALFDRLFTWCHVFPLQGKLGLSACTTGSDGDKETGEFLEKMLATYGVSSFGTISSRGAFQSGEFPKRAIARRKNAALAKRVARRILRGESALPVNRVQRRMFGTMRRKVMGIHTIHTIAHGPVEGQPRPPRLKLWMMRKIFRRLEVTDEQMARWADSMPFEYNWWKARGWLSARSFQALVAAPVPPDFDVKMRLLYLSPEMASTELV